MRRHRHVSGLFFLALSLVFPLFCPRHAGSQDAEKGPGIGPTIETVLGQIEEREGARYWALVSRLEALGKDALPALRSKLAGAGEKGRLAISRTIVTLGGDDGRTEALAALEELARKAEAKEVRVAAIETLGAEGDPDDVLPLIQGILDGTVDPAIVIPAARVLWEIDRVAGARDRLVDLLGSQDIEVKQMAALALAEIDYFEGDVREVLRSLKRNPTPEGRRAADLDRILSLSRQLDRGLEKGDVLLEGTDPAKLLKIKEERIRELEEKLSRTDAPRSSPALRRGEDAVLDEVILQIQKVYVDEAKTDRKRLVLGALKGMVRSLDDFSFFMDNEETASFRQTMSGEYPGIGAQVNKSPDGPLEILKPLYGGPAYKAGILSGDRILEVDGIRTDETALEEVIGKLKGPAGSTVRLRVYRRGWDEPRPFEIVRQIVEVASVHYESLPGKLGYLQLHQFGDRSAEEFIRALDALEKEGMGGLIIDLRNNGGGLLDSAVRIVDQFVSGDLPIVTQKGRGKTKAEDEVSQYPDPFTRPDYPIVVLINGRSASASEIVSGALKDFGRATLVGARTFGKGSVQRLIPLSSEAQKILGGESQLRLTVQYYFLPLGRCIHTIRDENGAVVEEGGVPPDIAVEDERIPAWRAEERERLRTQSRVLDYVDAHSEEIQKLFAEGDQHDISRYPGFDELHKSLETPAPREDLRTVIRFHARRRLEDARGREFACDFQDDRQLQRAILELLKKRGERPEDYPRYAWLAQEAK